jgi:hypothetical protein
MQLRQLQISNDGVQDRLILRIGTQANEEFRAYFTRRFLRQIWPHLSAMLAGHLANATSSTLSPVIGETQDYEQPFQEDGVTFPLGSTPLLVSEAILEPCGDGAARLTLREGRERSINLDLNNELLQVFCTMLRAANEHAEWGLELNDASPSPHNPSFSRAGLLH